MRRPKKTAVQIATLNFEPAVSFPPTPEQQDTLDKFHTGKRLGIAAFAGSGKTTTLEMLANSTDKRGLYLPFNSDTAKDAAKRFPGRVECSTQHSLAVRSDYGRAYRHKFNPYPPKSFLVAAELGLGTQFFARPGHPNPVVVSRNLRGEIVRDTVARWCHSGDDSITSRHVPLPDKLGWLPSNEKAAFKAKLADEAAYLWGRIADKSHAMTHWFDTILKGWALTKPVLDADYIMGDEFQDTNHVVLKLFTSQQAQLVAVGDTYQQIYSWRGSVDAMDKFGAEVEASLTTSWRFGPAVAGYANSVLRLLGARKTLNGNPDRTSFICEIEGMPDAILARTNATLVGLAISYIDAGVRPYVPGGLAVGGYIAATKKLQAGQRADHPDFLGYENWEAVRQAVAKGEDNDLAPWKRLLDKYTLEDIERAASLVAKSPKGAQITLSTGHRAKGREWARVRLCHDFLHNVKKSDNGRFPEPGAFEEELRLLYVAATRAKEQLEIPEALAIKFNLLRGIAEAA
jgi:UvrD-like helicase family protein